MTSSLMCRLQCTAKFPPVRTVQKAEEEPHAQFLDRVEEDCDVQSCACANNAKDTENCDG